MAHYEEVKYSKSQIKKAGKRYIAPDTDNNERNRALVLINNWRAAHSFPLQVYICTYSGLHPLMQ